MPALAEKSSNELEVKFINKIVRKVTIIHRLKAYVAEIKLYIFAVFFNIFALFKMHMSHKFAVHCVQA